MSHRERKPSHHLTELEEKEKSVLGQFIKDSGCSIPARCREEGQLPLYSQTPHHQTLIFTCCAQLWPSERMTREFYPPTKHPLHQTTPLPMTMLRLELFNKEVSEKHKPKKGLTTSPICEELWLKEEIWSLKEIPKDIQSPAFGGQCFNHLYLLSILYWAAYTIKKKCVTDIGIVGQVSLSICCI